MFSLLVLLCSDLNIQEPRAFYCFNDAGILVSKYYSAPTMLNFHNHLAKERKCLSECEIVILLLEFISILQTVHKCEILHGDLKPDNVIMRVPEVVPRNKKEFFTGWSCFMLEYLAACVARFCMFWFFKRIVKIFGLHSNEMQKVFTAHP